jgi:hypothetical protein
MTGSTSGSEADAFVDRIERADFAFKLQSAVDRLSFSGQSAGSCVTFSMTETVGRDELVYHFDGHISDVHFMEGNFRGAGPERCTTDGTFTVDVR